MWFYLKRNKLASKILSITGYKPSNIGLYKLALTHASILGKDDDAANSNERLEFLGDAILDSIVAEYLFKKFPYQNEGFLTEIKSRIVKRDSLNELAMKLHLPDLIEINSNSVKNPSKYLYGNALEAFIGAVFLDKGFRKTRKFVIKKMIKPYIDIDDLISTTDNFKSKILEWADKNGKKAQIEIIKEIKHKNHTEFFAEVKVDDQICGNGKGNSKKRAEQSAAQEACIFLEII